MSKNGWQAPRLSCQFKRQLPQWLLKKLPKQKNERIESGALCTNAVVALYCKVRKKFLYLFCRAGSGVAHVMKANKPLNPMAIGLLGFVGNKELVATVQCVGEKNIVQNIEGIELQRAE